MTKDDKTMDQIRKRFANRPDPNCQYECGCFERYERAQKAWQKENNFLRSEVVKLADRFKAKVREIVKQEDEIERLKKRPHLVSNMKKAS
ncbi:hypothetical protein MYX65_03235 [Acidobacteria bacterium AH-259-L09]|nr:hypothetical protein [Acidobacteria bacterium AH-259-L09]